MLETCSGTEPAPFGPASCIRVRPFRQGRRPKSQESRQVVVAQGRRNPMESTKSRYPKGKVWRHGLFGQVDVHQTLLVSLFF